MSLRHIPHLPIWVLALASVLILSGCQTHWRVGYSLIGVLKPAGPVVDPGNRPDYRQLDAWALHPDQLDTSPALPFGLEAAASSRAAVFYVHPTSHISRASWNQSAWDEPDSLRDEVYLPNQASVFKTCCSVYAPYYRQATFFSFVDRGTKGPQALDLAYGDVARAFTAFLESIGPDTPFILAGHSQGAAHLHRLIHDRLTDGDLRHRLVAAILPGYVLDEAGPVPACTHPSQTGCFLSWNMRFDRAFIPAFFPTAPVWMDDDYVRHVREPVCHDLTEHINVPASYLGGFYPTAHEEAGPSLRSAGFSGTCTEGWLVITPPEDRRFREVMLSGGWAHAYEYALVWAGIAETLDQRLSAYEERGS